MNPKYLLAFMLGALLLLGACSQNDLPAPKKTVISLFGAMENDDKAALTAILDLPELMKNINQDYALQTDSPRVFTDPEQILDDLTGDGLTKRRWFSLQRIINTATISGETAIVDVTFVDKERSRGYRSNFGLHMVNGKWRIYSFKTMQGSR